MNITIKTDGREYELESSEPWKILEGRLIFTTRQLRLLKQALDYELSIVSELPLEPEDG